MLVNTDVLSVKPYELTDEQWKLVRPVFDPQGRRGAKARRLRPRMVEAILWWARTGRQRRELPGRFGPWLAVWAQWRRWRDKGVWAEAAWTGAGWSWTGT